MDTRIDLSRSRDLPLVLGAELVLFSLGIPWVKYSKGAELTGLLPDKVADDDDLLPILLGPWSSVLYKSRIDGPSSTKLTAW